MTKKIPHKKSRAGIIFLEFLAVVTVLIIIGGGVLTWRITHSPLDINFIKEEIESALKDPLRGNYARVGNLSVHWPDLNGPILLEMRNGAVFNAQDQEILNVDQVALSLKAGPLFLGRLAIEELIVQNPSLDIRRDEDGNFDIGITGLQETTPEPDSGPTTDFTTRILSYMSSPGAEEADRSPLSTLQRLKIEEAALTYFDPLLNAPIIVDKASAVFESTDDGLKADILIPFSQDSEYDGGTITGEILVPWESKEVFAKLELQKFGLETLTGKIKLLEDFKDQNFVFDMQIDAHLGPDLTLYKSALSMRAEDGRLHIPYISAERLPYQDFIFDITYDAGRKILHIQNLSINLAGLPVAGFGTFGVLDDEITGPVRLEIDRLAQHKLVDFWPVGLDEENAREWAVDKLSEGFFEDLFASAEVRLRQLPEGWDFSLSRVVAGFDFQDMTIDYKAPLTPISAATGHALFERDVDMMNIHIEEGQAGDLKITGANASLHDLVKENAGEASINIDLEGPLAGVMRFLADEPIGLNHTYDLAQVKGQATGNIQLDFPIRDEVLMEDVALRVDGQVRDVFLPDVVGSLDLSQGPFSISVAENIYTIKGKGALNGEPVTLEETGFLESEGKPHKSILSAQMNATQELREAMGIDLSDFLAGPARLNVKYKDINDTQAEADIIADLTPSRFFLEPFGYEKLPGIEGRATMLARIENNDLIEIQNLQLSAPQVQVQKGRLVFTQENGETEILQARLPQFSVGETVGSLEVEREGANGYKIALDGAFFDLRPFLEDEENEKAGPQTEEIYDNPPIRASISVDRMRAADDHVMRQGRIYADIDGQGRFNQLELDAIAGQGDVYLRFKPDDQGMRTFRYEADDAGAALAAFGMYDKIRGGKMVIYGEPIRGGLDRNIVGVAEITNFKVVDAPTLARLLNALSVPGLLGLLDGEGIAFSKLEAKFDWLFRPGGSLLVLKDGRTSGSELGLTFDGTFDNYAGTLDVSGTIIPLSTVNKIVGSIPLIGDIVTGGTGSLIAATYTLKGKSEDPTVSVNPLSVLAPGILRRILFEN